MHLPFAQCHMVNDNKILYCSQRRPRRSAAHSAVCLQTIFNTSYNQGAYMRAVEGARPYKSTILHITKHQHAWGKPQAHTAAPQPYHCERYGDTAREQTLRTSLVSHAGGNLRRAEVVAPYDGVQLLTHGGYPREILSSSVCSVVAPYDEVQLLTHGGYPREILSSSVRSVVAPYDAQQYSIGTNHIPAINNPTAYMRDVRWPSPTNKLVFPAHLYKCGATMCLGDGRRCVPQ